MFALKNHVRIVHEKSKPFVCGFEGCGMAFGFKKVLARHEHTHTHPAPPRVYKKAVKEVTLLDDITGTENGRNISCTVEGCEWRFARQGDLKRHLRNMHNERAADDELPMDDTEAEDNIGPGLKGGIDGGDDTDDDLVPVAYDNDSQED